MVVAPSDGSGDIHPDFPEDSDVELNDVCKLYNLTKSICLGKTQYVDGKGLPFKHLMYMWLTVCLEYISYFLCLTG